MQYLQVLLKHYLQKALKILDDRLVVMQQKDIVKEKSALKKNVTADEVGDVATFLFSNMSACITGQTIYADSGYNIMGM